LVRYHDPVTDRRREIETLIRARYPILYVVTWEEARVVSWICELAKKRDKRVYEWSFNHGLVAAGLPAAQQRTRGQATRDPLVALDQVFEQVEPALYLFKDFHPFLKAGSFAVVRKLKELAAHLRSTTKTLVIVAPALEVPVELEKEVTVVDFPLPGVEELGGLLDRMIEELKADGRVRIELDAAARERLLKSALGLTLTEAENVLAKLVVTHARLSAEDVDVVFAEKRQIIRKSGLLEYHEPRESVADIGGLELLKEWLGKRALAFSDRAKAFGLPAPKGMLLLGVQGCGKSLCAKAVAALWRMPLLRFDVGRMFGSLVGSSEENMRRAIAVAESVAPCILWVDEIDKAFAGSQSGGAADSGTTARVFGTFLTWLSEKTAPVFVIATANQIGQLPPELLRKGRFDEMFFVDLPGREERREIARIHLSKRGRDPARFDLGAVADRTGGFSGAEIEEAVVSGLYDAFTAGRELETRDVLGAAAATVPLSRTMDREIAELREWSKGRARPASRDTIPS
jgi:SpoVK/Ycf46/Vps4 family AAA+-type ATPase